MTSKECLSSQGGAHLEV